LSGSSRFSRWRSSSGFPLVVLAILIWTALLFALLAIGSASGCARTVLVPESSPVRVGPCARARVYALIDGEWVLSGNSVELEEGWYLVPPSYVEEN
jgi:hypothetical protein